MLLFNCRGKLNICFWEGFATKFEETYDTLKEDHVILIIASGKVQEYKGMYFVPTNITLRYLLTILIICLVYGKTTI